MQTVVYSDPPKSKVWETSKKCLVGHAVVETLSYSLSIHLQAAVRWHNPSWHSPGNQIISK